MIFHFNHDNFVWFLSTLSSLTRFALYEKRFEIFDETPIIDHWTNSNWKWETQLNSNGFENCWNYYVLNSCSRTASYAKYKNAITNTLILVFPYHMWHTTKIAIVQTGSLGNNVTTLASCLKKKKKSIETLSSAYLPNFNRNYFNQYRFFDCLFFSCVNFLFFNMLCVTLIGTNMALTFFYLTSTHTHVQN